MTLFEIEDVEAAAERGEHVEQGRARGFMPRFSMTRVASGKSSAAQRKKAAEEMSPGMVASIAERDWPPVMLMVSAVRVELGTEGAEGDFAVVAGADLLAERGGAIGLETGEEDCGLDLRGGDGSVKRDGGERAPRGW